MKRDHQESTSSSSEVAGPSMAERGKLWDHQGGDDMDELLAVLGYKVRSSDMADVAQKLEQLEMVLSQEDAAGSNLLNDTVHYNPSDLSGWVETMLSELNNPEPDLDPIQSGIRSQNECCHASGHKWMRIGSGSEFDPGESARRVVLVDSQETGVRLVHTLVACAEAVQREDMGLADALVKRVGLLAASQNGAMRKVATYFAEALARRIYRIYPRDLIDEEELHMHFYESCPYLKFAHFTANQAILEAFSGSDRVHVIDFGLKQGMQWPALMQALALRPGGPPSFRLTGIGQPRPDCSDFLQRVGFKLAQLARTIGIEFEFKGFVASSLSDLEPEMFDTRPGSESVAVNSVFELHRLLARPGLMEKVLSTVKAVGPRIFTAVEHEASHNGAVFMDRFNESLHYYSSMFDSLEGPVSPERVMSELYLGRQILNVVACEGADRVERHEPLSRWRTRMETAGFQPVHLGSNAFKQASMLLALFAGGDGYKVEENDGSLMLGWHTRPLIATSAWQIADDEATQLEHSV